MVTARPHDSYRNREVTGFLLSLAFAGLASLRDVCFGGLFQKVNPLLVALTAFGLCSLVFLPIALISDPAGLTALARRSQPFWANATTGVAWLSYFFALRAIEPALVQVLFYGIGPHPPIRSSTGLDGAMAYNGPAHRAVPEPRC